MISLYDFELLQNDVFYRSEHILKYIERHQDITPLDKIAIANTILDALVYKNLMDPETQSLDLDTLSIKNSLDYITYDSTPNISGIPLSIKEQMRKKCVVISAGVTIGIFCAKPAGPVHTCIYDMNTAFSIIFSSFSFLECDYDSPTRPGVRVEKRPFIEVSINGENYIVDLLTKRIFKSSWFTQNFNLEITHSVSSKEFTPKQVSIYQEQTQDHNELATHLSFMDSLYGGIIISPKQEEAAYEREQSKIYFPEVIPELEAIRQDKIRLGLITE